MARQFWLSDAQWSVIEPMLPHLGGKPRVDDRRVISGILHVLKTGCRWRDVPAEYGPATTIYNKSSVDRTRRLAAHVRRHCSGRRHAGRAEP